MDSDTVGMIVMVTAILTTGGVLIFRPIAKRIGNLLEAMTLERMRPGPAHPPAAEIARVMDTLDRIDTRLDQIEDRQDFAEALISTGGDPKLLSLPAHLRAQERN